MSKCVLGIFQSEVVAEEAVEDLRNAGFSKDISIIAKDRDSEEGNRESRLTMSENETVSDGATTDGILGGVAGLATGAGALCWTGECAALIIIPFFQQLYIS